MKGLSEYRYCREGRWHLIVHNQRWSRELWETVFFHLAALPAAPHPQIVRLRYPLGDHGQELYLKVFHPWHLSGILKDLFRNSRALRAWKQGVALSREGFHVPLALAAGEERAFRWLKRSFLLTAGVEASPLRLFLEEVTFCSRRDLFREKRERLEKLACEVRRLHQLGFIHGDLVPSNILVRTEAGNVAYYFIDHDRTRRYPLWLNQTLRRRNLVQLNRFPLPRIFVQDRLRFLRFYLDGKVQEKEEQRLVRWLEKKTRKRRLECDRVDAPVSFRKLMQWNGPFARRDHL